MLPSDRIDQIFKELAKTWYRKADGSIDFNHDYKKYPLREIEIMHIETNAIQHYLDEVYKKENK